MSKPISMRVDLITELLIEQLVLSGAGKNRSDIFKKAVYQMAVQQLSEEEMASLMKIAMDQEGY